MKIQIAFSLMIALLASTNVIAGGSETLPRSITDLLKSHENEYKPAKWEVFSRTAKSQSSNPMHIAADFNGDGHTDYGVIVKGLSGPYRLFGFINDGKGKYSQYNLNMTFKIYSNELGGHIEKYNGKLAKGFLTSDPDTRLEISFQNDAILIDKIKSRSVAFWDAQLGKFSRVVTSD